jgi:CRISPR-associated endonuclease/helicase Cas3
VVTTPRQRLDFEAAYRTLDAEHRPPLRWQSRLYERFVRGGVENVPGVCRLPTGLGKTSVIPIWLVALASGARLPRRLVYVVNRRTVVDQATDDASRLRGLIERPASAGVHEATVCRLRDSLSHLSGEPGVIPLAVSTLRGELADNGEWKKNPARPAIIIGTVDMIGSKLLFSGYGDGRYGRAHHAGLIGQDALVVHDEAHLEPAFDELLTSICEEQRRAGEPRPIRVMRLSATTRAMGAEGHGGTDANPPFGIEDDDRQDQVVSQRLGARKSLTIVDADKGKVAPRIAEEALRLGASPSRVLVYVRSPDAVAQIAEAIEKKLGDGGATRIARLTGTIRGKERDELAESEVFRAFKTEADRSSPLTHSLYLVSTSAGEVGADWDADHLVCDLSTLDSVAQRFGRVNRLGGKERSATITVVAEPIGDKVPLKAQIEAAARLLRELPEIEVGRDVSPAALSALLATPEAQAAFSPVPAILPATDILFDHWSLTSIAGQMPGRPEVGPYLHGVADWEPPETHVAWRADIALLAAAGGKDDKGEAVPCSKDELDEVFESFPLRSVEQLRDRTDRVQAELRKIADRLNEQAQHRAVSPPADHAESEESNNTSNEAEGEGEVTKGKGKPIEPNPWVVLMRAGTVEWVRLEEFAPADNDDAKRAQRSLAFATVVLPVEAGGLKDGMLEGKQPPQDALMLDVAEDARDGTLARQRVIVKGDESRALLGRNIVDGVTKASAIIASGDDDAEPARIEYRVAKGQDREPGQRIALGQHHQAVSEAAVRIGRALGLDDQLMKALRLAGRWHDAGKARAIWQRYANNWDATEGTPRDGQPIAKSERYAHWKTLAGYRHEFGSLHDAPAADEIRSLDSDTRDLVLHLIAAHHGWARPHFEPRHFGPGDPGTPRPTADNERLAVEAMQRFARLQQCFGRWGLAWLESILRCADAEASESPGPADRGAGAGSKRESTPGGAA